MAEVNHVIQGIVIEQIGKNTKRPVSACSLKTVSLHWLVSPLSFSLPFKDTWNKMSSNEDTNVDKVHLFLFSGKWFHGIPNHAQSKSKRFYVSNAFRAGGNSWGSGSPSAHDCSCSLLQEFGSSADLPFENFQLLNLLHPLLSTFPRRLKRKLLQRSRDYQ